MSARPEDVIADALHMPRYWPDDVRFKRPSAILAALRTAGFVIEQGWQPIETAPMDGTRILAWITHRVSDNGKKVDIPTVVSWWGHDADCWVEDGYDTVHPTHWRPLPTPPEGQP